MAALTTAFVAPAAAAHVPVHAGAAAGMAKAAASDGTVNVVDKAAGKITIKHGPLNNLGMPPMTMAFAAGDPAMLDKVKAGEKVLLKVRFIADEVGGSLTVTDIEPAG